MYVSRKIYVAIDEPHWLRPMRAKNDVVDLNLLLSLLVLLLLLLHTFFSLSHRSFGNVDMIEFVVRAIIWSIVWRPRRYFPFHVCSFPHIRLRCCD